MQTLLLYLTRFTFIKIEHKQESRQNFHILLNILYICISYKHFEHRNISFAYIGLAVFYIFLSLECNNLANVRNSAAVSRWAATASEDTNTTRRDGPGPEEDLPVSL